MRGRNSFHEWGLGFVMTQRFYTVPISDVLLLQYIDQSLPAESPHLYGLHPNAEIGFLTQTSEQLFRTVLEMQPRDGGVGEGGAPTREEKVIIYSTLHVLKHVDSQTLHL